MWIWLSLLSAVGAAGVGFALKRSLTCAGAVGATVAYRAVGGGLLLALVVGAGLARPVGSDYVWAVAIAIPFELVGTVAFTLALREGELSLVSPLFGLLPVTVTLGAALALGEQPTAGALAGIGLVAVGVYVLGLGGARGLWEPLRALATHPAGRWAGVSVLAWSVTAVVHKIGIAASGAMPWAVTLALGSAVALLAAAPFLPRSLRTAPEVASPTSWLGWTAAAGALYAVQQVGLQNALERAPAGYVIALSSVSILLGVVAGIVLLRERGAGRSRLGGAGLVTLGAALVAIYG
ncbi:DMT family transporter [Rubrivirga marina]|uniref:EamA domain-containing protein n=1 Tax=Rubrivirga marina TaxID=1196024 RepID=A0A271IUM5_9BACT|nr:DMT family transporter [Rubrivirga marina]PAP74951.1 hypothetical protein BSZ37_00040 [Rubrivirga marina]